MLNASAGLAAELATVSSHHMKGQMIMATITHTRPAPADSGIQRIIVGHPLTAYFVLAFGLMWVFALPRALSRNQGSGVLPYDLSDTLGNVLFLLATFSGPTVAALIVTGMTEGRAGVRRLLKRC